MYDPRYSFASRALALGETLPVISKLLGHNDIEKKARYTHLAHDSIYETVERIAESILAAILYGIPPGSQNPTLSGSTIPFRRVAPNHPLASTGEILAPEPFV